MRWIEIEIFKPGCEMIGWGVRESGAKEDADDTLPYLVAVALPEGQFGMADAQQLSRLSRTR